MSDILVLTGDTIAEFQASKNAPYAPKSDPEPKSETQKPAESSADLEDGEGEADADAEKADDDAGKKPDKQNGINKRFKELTDARKAAEARAEAAERKAAEYELATKKPEPQTLKDGEPDPAKYEDQRTYFKDLARWEIRQEQAENEAKATKEKRALSWREKVAKVIEAQPDFEEVIQNTTSDNVSDLAQEEIMDADNGPQILRYFAENPDYVRDFNKLTLAKQVAKIAKLDASFEKPAEKAEEKKVVTAEKSKAPEPRKPIESVKGGALKPVEEMTQAEFEAADRAGKFK
jgi:hypothetical protein